ncbi:MAG: glycosyltransferase family 1 protein [Gemmatimonadetes bacterium]|nr:glycosyltransferase family 1 protein [Gemmatimonadota bacterium]
MWNTDCIPAGQDSPLFEPGAALTLDIICLSHLRWNFVFQRPQHLLARAAQGRRVFFVEEPVQWSGAAHLSEYTSAEGVRVFVPHLQNPDLGDSGSVEIIRELLQQLYSRERIASPVLWHYSPMWEPVSAGMEAAAVVYDCMDELSAFRFAPADLLRREQALLERADLVFTGGLSLYEAKQGRHPGVHLFPSSVDVEHWARARASLPEPADMAGIDRPRLGFAGVVDERMDLDLLSAVVSLRPEWQWILVGPIVKIEPSSLPQATNLHLLGGKQYAELPAYLAHWDVALMPFALNESTRYISPTKTPEYLAAGLPVVSTPIRDVVRSYGEHGVVEIAGTPEAFVAACERSLAGYTAAKRAAADAMLATQSWDRTWSEMDSLIREITVPAAIHFYAESSLV